jgi:uncharacterized membrane protein
VVISLERVLVKKTLGRPAEVKTEGMKLYQLFMFFFIYGFIGWCLEVCYHALETGKWSNRGFLNGAICPIYGIGVVVILYVLEPISEFGPLLFVGGVVLCSAIELMTGYVMEKIFHQRWWDYSSERFNVKGYICLKFSLYWGVGIVFIIKIVHPSIQRFVDWIPYEMGVVILIIAWMVLALDAVDTFRTIIGINKELETIHEAASVIRKVSDGISERLFEGTMRAVEEKAELGQKIQDNREELGQRLQSNKEELELQMALGRAEMETKAADLKEIAEEMARKLKRGQARMLRAFPNMRSTRYEADMDAVRELIGKVTLGRRK